MSRVPNKKYSRGLEKKKCWVGKTTDIEQNNRGGCKCGVILHFLMKLKDKTIPGEEFVPSRIWKEKFSDSLRRQQQKRSQMRKQQQPKRLSNKLNKIKANKKRGVNNPTTSLLLVRKRMGPAIHYNRSFGNKGGRKFRREKGSKRGYRAPSAHRTKDARWGTSDTKKEVKQN